MAERPKPFDFYLFETHELQSPTEETPEPVEERKRLPYEIDDANAEKTAVDRPVTDDKESSEQPKEPEEEDGSVTIKRRKENKNRKAPRDESKTKKRAANPESGSKSRKRRSPTSTLPALDEVSNVEDPSSEQLELLNPMVSEESGNDNLGEYTFQCIV